MRPRAFFLGQILGGLFLGGVGYFLREPLLVGSQGLLWDPMSGLVVGLAWRGWLGAAAAAGLVPLAGGPLAGGPEVAGLWTEAILAWGLAQSESTLGRVNLRNLIILPMAAGVTVAGTLVEQLASFSLPFGPGFGILWAGHALGVMALAPLLAKGAPGFLAKLDRRLFLGWVLLTILLILVARVASFPGIDPASRLALGLIPLVILFWQAMRFGQAGSSTACFITALMAGLAWQEGNLALEAFPPGIFAMVLTVILGTCHGMAALHDERSEIEAWTESSAQTHRVAFWRWQRGQGVEWDDPTLAAELGLRSQAVGWGLAGGWRAENSLPDPRGNVPAVVVRLSSPGGGDHAVELAAKVHARDPAGQPSVVLGTALDVTDRIQSQSRREKLLRREGELRALRSQLHPHVIFNALNRIAALTMCEPERARDLLVRLSRLLRAALLAGEKDTTGTTEELSLIRDYLELEGAGYGERLRFRNEIAEGSGSRFPPLLLFSLVEGAVRRGVGMRKEGATITLRQPQPGVFRVEADPAVPTGEAEFPAWPDPLWVERLAVGQPPRFRLTVERENGGIRAVEIAPVGPA